MYVYGVNSGVCVGSGDNRSNSNLGRYVMGRHKNTPTSQLTDVQIVREERPKARYYQATERKRWPRTCVVCGELVVGTLGDLERHWPLCPSNVQPAIETQYDYDNQAWIVNGRYENCAHPTSMECGCYGRLHKGEKAPSIH